MLKGRLCTRWWIFIWLCQVGHLADSREPGPDCRLHGAGAGSGRIAEGPTKEHAYCWLVYNVQAFSHILNLGVHFGHYSYTQAKMQMWSGLSCVSTSFKMLQHFLTHLHSHCCCRSPTIVACTPDQQTAPSPSTKLRTVQMRWWEET